MAIRDQIMQMAEGNPQLTQAVDAMERGLVNAPITPEDLDDLIEFLEFAVQHPESYAELRQAAIDDGKMDEGVMPPEFNMVFVVSLLVALYGLQDRLKQRGYARGGLAIAARRVQAAGRGGDTQLAHINRREAEMLRQAGGSGTINPDTGLKQYGWGWKQIVGAAAPIALSIIAPGIGTAIGSSIAGTLLGGTAAAGLIPMIAPALGGALLGAGGAALGGGNPIQGALMGGLGAGAGGLLGGAIDSGIGLGLPDYAKNMLGSALIGGGGAAAMGRNPFSGALRGAAGAGIEALAGGVGQEIGGMGPGAGGAAGVGRGVAGAGKGFGTALAAGMDPKAAAVVGGLSGLAAGLVKPSQQVVRNMSGEVPLAETIEMPDGTLAPKPGSQGVMPDGRPATYQLNQTTGQIDLTPTAGNYQVVNGRVEFVPQQQGLMQQILGQGAAPAAGGAGGGGQQTGILGNLLGGNVGGTLALAGAAASAMSGMRSAPPQVQQAVSTLPADQQEYFNRPSVAWDWGKMQQDASASGLTLNQFMSVNWPRITAGTYNRPAMAQGGPLSAVARFARGAGTGRSDEIDAKLSDGEYVIDAETVSLLGDGSSKAGAEKLDRMRREIRSHKGKALSKGKFSPDAKSPLSYLKGVA